MRLVRIRDSIMETKFRELVKILEELIADHRELLSVEQKKLQSIINQDLKELDDLIAKSKKILKSIEASEKKRLVVVKELCGTEKATITQIGKKLSEKRSDELISRAGGLKSLILEQKELNERVEYLLKDSLDIINFSVSLFAGRSPHGRTYSVAGEEKSTDEKPSSLVLDIKA
jgi:hypothetical protein